MSKTRSLMLDGVPSFVIKSITASECRGLGVDTPDVTVEIVMPNALFLKLKKKDDIGSLVIDVNNKVHEINKHIPSYCPTIGGLSGRASRGIKTLTFVYHIRELSTAKALGIPVHEFKNSWSAQYGAYVDLLTENKPKLTIVS